jgi:hypothetical protein
MRCDATKNVTWVSKSLSRDDCLTHWVRTWPGDAALFVTFSGCRHHIAGNIVFFLLSG